MNAGLELHAGHGLNYHNVAAIAQIDHMAELNIGHSIISRSLFVGLTEAVREMKECIKLARTENLADSTQIIQGPTAACESATCLGKTPPLAASLSDRTPI